MEKGNLSINSENILPIIKKWLYSDTDIFVRELVSNATDAVNKLKKLVELGEAANVAKDETYAINVVLDKANRTIQVMDNGIGMTEEEIKKYINQIAFSGASDFMEKFKDKIDKENEIIGHFGLGFYSAFMVADKVQIDTLSFQEGALPARWVCEGGIEYEMSPGEHAARGTAITLFVNEDEQEYLEEYKLREVLNKYCGFMPVNIFFSAVEDKAGAVEDEADNDEIVIDGAEAAEDAETTVEPPKPLNDTSPLWLKQPSECTDEEYKAFYHKVFMDFSDPLFWIHLNMDYPFRLKGILYFPKLKHELESIEGQVKLYCNQVYIADNIKEVIPEFMLLLKGVMDCPDLPLNVSRSFLQNDGTIRKMSGYITRKVADKLNSLCKKEREGYNGYWDDIAPFIKYGCIRDKDFYDKVKDSILFKTTAGAYDTLPEFLEKNKEKTNNTVYYVSNEQQQAQYVKLFKEQGLEAVILTTNLDNPFMSYLESYNQDVHFNRIDSDLSSHMKNEAEGEKDEAKKAAEEGLLALFKRALQSDGLNVSDLKISVESLKTDSVAAVILLSEQGRRMQEMSKMFGGGMGMPMFPNEETLVLNTNNRLVQKLMEVKDDASRQEDVNLLCQQVYDLAMMSHKPLDTEAMTKFMERSNRLMEKVL